MDIREITAMNNSNLEEIKDSKLELLKDIAVSLRVVREQLDELIGKPVN